MEKNCWSTNGIQQESVSLAFNPLDVNRLVHVALTSIVIFLQIRQILKLLEAMEAVA